VARRTACPHGSLRGVRGLRATGPACSRSGAPWSRGPTFVVRRRPWGESVRSAVLPPRVSPLQPRTAP